MTYENQLLLVKKGVTSGGFLGSSTKLILPNEPRASATVRNVYEYACSNDPRGDFKVTKASGKAGSSSISVTLSKKPTQTQIYLTQYLEHEGEAQGAGALKLSFQKATFRIGYEDTNEYVAYCTMTKGSKNAVITLYEDTLERKKVKLKKNTVYTLDIDGSTVSFTAS
ncbi:MAG: hypothetical protein Q4F41_13870 [Eubacteriales bacterium]|nr:hypothetical protein [Eubacteriales bacterium]